MRGNGNDTLCFRPHCLSNRPVPHIKPLVFTDYKVTRRYAILFIPRNRRDSLSHAGPDRTTAQIAVQRGKRRQGSIWRHGRRQLTVGGGGGRHEVCHVLSLGDAAAKAIGDRDTSVGFSLVWVCCAMPTAVASAARISPSIYVSRLRLGTRNVIVIWVVMWPSVCVCVVKFSF